MLSSWSSTTRMRPCASGLTASRGASATGAGVGTGRSATGSLGSPGVLIASAITPAWPDSSSAGILGGVLAEEALHFGHHGARLAGLGQIAVAPHFPRLL